MLRRYRNQSPGYRSVGSLLLGLSVLSIAWPVAALAANQAASVDVTTLSTSLTGDGQSASSISVPAGTAVTDSATLSGANASSATGTVTYDVFSDAACSDAVSSGSPEEITTP